MDRICTKRINENNENNENYNIQREKGQRCDDRRICRKNGERKSEIIF